MAAFWIIYAIITVAMFMFGRSSSLKDAFILAIGWPLVAVFFGLCLFCNTK